MRRFRPNTRLIHQANEIYFAMEKATTEAEFQKLLVEMDSIQAASRQGPFKLRTLEEFRRGPTSEYFNPWKKSSG